MCTVSEKLRLTRPWLVAVWPGMGHVALNAGIYLLAKLGMTEIAEFEAGELFDVDAVEVSGGIIQSGQRPRSRFFAWADPNGRHDLVIFVGEAQPPAGKYWFCRRVIEFARELGVERVFTFAAMATGMHPGDECRVFAAATDRANLDELKRLELDIFEDGHIGGLNGVLLGAAAAARLPGACLLGEMPHIFAQLPFPKASQAILEAFATLAGIELDLTELAEQAQMVEERLGEILARAEAEMEDDEEEEGDGGEFEEPGAGAGEETERPDAAAQRRAHRQVEALFDIAAKDRTKAFELKRELDRHGLFKEYENRFLDLFKKSE